MEVIKNNFEATEMIEMSCPHCGSILKCTVEEKENDVCPICSYPLTERSTNVNMPKRFLECEKCDHGFFATPDGIGLYGLYYTYCPKCGAITYFDDGIEVNAENLKLEHFSEPKDGLHVDFSEIKKFVQIGVNYLKNNPDENYHYSATGDSFILVTRDENEFYVMYTDNYRDVWVE